MNATVEFDSDDGFETTETEEEEVEEEELEEIVETIGGDKEVIFEAMEEEQEADVDPKEPTYLPTMSPTNVGPRDPTYLPTMSPTDECFRDGTECQDCSNECCSGDLGDGSGWFKCANGMEFCGDQNVLGAVLC